MPTAAFTTLGCKVNQYETQKILERFEALGFEIVPFDAPADVYVINTCSVTQTAEAKSRQTVRRAARQNPNAVVVMTGCYAQFTIRRGERLEEAHLVVPNPDKLRIAEYLLEHFPHFKEQLAQARQKRRDAHSPTQPRRAENPRRLQHLLQFLLDSLHAPCDA
jgi:threonylcarbamoyladenosine tRNA methylthiotransferase MtaB